MKLGITVVYFVKKGDGWLIDLHLKFIRRCTGVPYKIYAGAERLLPEYMKQLDAEDIMVCPLQQTDNIAGKENSFYLEQLFQIAINDGCTHIATFHVDSFPVRPDWVEYLMKKLDAGFQLAAIERAEDNDHKPHSSFIFFPASYYLEYQPELRLEEEVTTGDLYKKYSRKFPHIQDSGFGYGYQLFKDNLEWYRMQRSNKRKDHWMIATIYDDLVFHLSGAGFTVHIFRKDKIWYWRKVAILKLLFDLLKTLRINVIFLEKKYVRGFEKSTAKQRINEKNNKAMGQIKNKLITDADRFLNYLRKL